MASPDTRWTRGFDPSDAEKFKELLYVSTTTLGRLLAILEDEDTTMARQQMTEKSFEDSNWAFKQAFFEGQRNQLRKTIALLSFLKE